MNRAGLIVVVAALVLAVTNAGTPALATSANSQQANVAVARVIDASVKSAPLLSEASRDQTHLATLLNNRDMHVVDVGERMNGDEAAMLSDLLHASDVLSQNVLLVQTIARNGGPLSDWLAAHDIPADRVVAVNLTDDTAAPVTVYLFKRS